MIAELIREICIPHFSLPLEANDILADDKRKMGNEKWKICRLIFSTGHLVFNALVAASRLRASTASGLRG